MVPMPFGVMGLFHGVGGGPPVADWRLSSQDQSGDPGARQPAQRRRDVLPAAALWIDEVTNVLGQAASRYWPIAMVKPPHPEQLGGRLAPTIPLLCLAHPIGRVPTAECNEWIADPAAPGLKAAERATGRQIPLQPAPLPDSQKRRQEFLAPLLDLGPDVVRKGTGFRVLGARIELDGYEAPGEVLRHAQAIAGEDHEGGGVQGNHLRATKNANPCRALGYRARQQVGAEGGVIEVVEEEDGTALHQLRRDALLQFLPVGAARTPAGFKALGIEQQDGATTENAPVATKLKPARAGKGGKAKADKPSRGRSDSKQAKLIAMLKAAKGASIDEIVAAFGWQPHTVRGAIAGALKKKLGLEVTSEKIDGRGRVYHIAG